MTKTEAIEYGLRWKNAICDRGDTENSEAVQFLNMAIKALEQEPIIRCKDCRYCNRDITIERNTKGLEAVVNECVLLKRCVNDTDFCSLADMRGDEE